MNCRVWVQTMQSNALAGRVPGWPRSAMSVASELVGSMSTTVLQWTRPAPKRRV
jgi:hypothetical protein